MTTSNKEEHDKPPERNAKLVQHPTTNRANSRPTTTSNTQPPASAPLLAPTGAMADESMTLLVDALHPHTIRAAATKWCTLSGYSPAEVLGKPVADLAHGQLTCRQTFSTLTLSMSLNLPQRVVLVHYTKAHEPYLCVISSTPSTGHEGARLCTWEVTPQSRPGTGSVNLTPEGLASAAAESIASVAAPSPAAAAAVAGTSGTSLSSLKLTTFTSESGSSNEMALPSTAHASAPGTCSSSGDPSPSPDAATDLWQELLLSGIVEDRNSRASPKPGASAALADLSAPAGALARGERSPSAAQLNELAEQLSGPTGANFTPQQMQLVLEMLRNPSVGAAADTPLSVVAQPDGSGVPALSLSQAAQHASGSPQQQQRRQTRRRLPSSQLRAAPFVTKLYEIVESPQNAGVIEWSSCGTCFRVLKPDLLESQVLPRYFKHNRFVFFTKQLRAYGFRQRIDGSAGEMAREWIDEKGHFRRGAVDELCFIQRAARGSSDRTAMTAATASASDTTAPLSSVKAQASSRGTKRELDEAPDPLNSSRRPRRTFSGVESGVGSSDGDLESNADSDGNSGSGDGSSGSRAQRASDSGEGGGGGGGSGGSSNGSGEGSGSATTARFPEGGSSSNTAPGSRDSRDSGSNGSECSGGGSRPVSPADLRAKIVSLNERVQRNRLHLRAQRSLILMRIDRICERIEQSKADKSGDVLEDVEPPLVNAEPVLPDEAQAGYEVGPLLATTTGIGLDELAQLESSLCTNRVPQIDVTPSTAAELDR